MNGFKQMSLALATAGVLTSGMAQAALIDRGGGLLYDDVLNVTWLQDANYAQTSGYDTSGYYTDGRMDWATANTWASSLNISRFTGESLTGWRLPTTAPVGVDWNYGWSPDGSADLGYNITSPHSELSYMYYVNLGLKGYYSPSGAYQPDWGIFRDGTGWGGQANVGLVKNLQSSAYWSGTAYAPDPASYAWGFYTSVGGQYGGSYQPSELYAWAVRPGDVAAAVPEPETYAMLLAGLGLLGAGAKWRRRSFGAS
jgi:hypothetical protein